MNSNSDAKSNQGLSLSTSTPVLTIPKIVMPSTYYKPTTQSNNVNLMVSNMKALSQQVGVNNIKNYMSSVKKTTIDLTSDFNRTKPLMNSNQKESKVKFSPNIDRRSDSADLTRYE